MLRSTTGEKLYTSLEVKVFEPGNELFKLYKHFPQRAGIGWNEEHIQKIVDEFIEQVDQAYPKREYRIVTLAKNRFNFVYVGERQAPASPEVPFDAEAQP